MKKKKRRNKNNLLSCYFCNLCLINNQQVQTYYIIKHNQFIWNLVNSKNYKLSTPNFWLTMHSLRAIILCSYFYDAFFFVCLKFKQFRVLEILVKLKMK